MMVLKSSDSSSNINIRFFYFHPAQTRQLKAGTELLCYGKVSLSRYGLEMIHPEYEVIADDHKLADERLTPVYRVPKGVGQKKLERLFRLRFLNLILKKISLMLSNTILR